MSSVPQVLTALGAVIGFDETPTYLLYVPSGAMHGDFNVVGWAGPETPSVNAEQVSIDYALAQNEDDYDVAVQYVAWIGTTDVMACISRLFIRYDHLVDSLTTDSRLVETCMNAAVSSWQLTPDVTEQGAQAILTVTVTIRAPRNQPNQ